jgi:MraZ protein
MPSLPKSEPIFSGAFRHALDGKKRVTIPSRWRGGGDEFFLQPHHKHRCLIAIPPVEFQEIREKALQRLPAEKQADFLRQFGSRSLHCTLDKQGRLLLSDDQCRAAGLQGEVVLVGLVGRFEVWNPEAWTAHSKQQDTDYKEVASAAGL